MFRDRYSVAFNLILHAAWPLPENPHPDFNSTGESELHLQKHSWSRTSTHARILTNCRSAFVNWTEFSILFCWYYDIPDGHFCPRPFMACFCGKWEIVSYLIRCQWRIVGRTRMSNHITKFGAKLREWWVRIVIVHIVWKLNGLTILIHLDSSSQASKMCDWLHNWDKRKITFVWKLNCWIILIHFDSDSQARYIRDRQDHWNKPNTTFAKARNALLTERGFSNYKKTMEFQIIYLNRNQQKGDNCSERSEIWVRSTIVERDV
jgi:hypothetical protein